MEWCLPGIVLLRCWQGGSIPAPLLANGLQALSPLASHTVQEVAPLLVHYIAVVPCRRPKHKENDRSSQKRTRSRKKLLDWVWKQSIKGRNDSYLNIYGSFKPKLTKSKRRFDWRELEKEPGFGQELRTEEDQKNWYIYLIPGGVTRFVSWNISPFVDSKVFHWSKWFRFRTNEG